MITRLFYFFPDDEIAVSYIKDIRTVAAYFEIDKIADARLRDELIQETIDYLQSLKTKTKDKK